MRKLWLVAALALFTVPAAAQDNRVKLKDGPGKDVVESKCASCHTMDYIVMNSPFLDRPKWDATIKKMITAFGAPIEPAEADQILDYLAKNYGG